MRSSIVKLEASAPLVYLNTGLPTNQFKTFLLQVHLRGLLIGQGSPSGVIEAEQGQEYLDETGIAGSIKWIKQLSDVGGDRTLGWVAIG